MLNKAILMGRLTADPELRQTPNGINVATFTLAVGRSYAKAGADRPTDFIDIVAWRNTADFVSKYFTKGMQVAVTGSIQTRTWKDKQDNSRKSVEVVADEVFFADSKRDSSQAGAQPAQGNFAAAPAFSAPADAGFQEIADDDDLPF